MTMTPLSHDRIEICYSNIIHEALGMVCFDQQPTGYPTLIIQPGLQPLQSGQPHEQFKAQGPVQLGHAGSIRHASDGRHLLAVLELAEAEYANIETAAASAYRACCDFNADSGYPHILRMWNYLDDINAGNGDAERYKRFCAGRARGFGELGAGQYPAASVLGRQRGNGRLQVYWLASRQAALPVENPRQLSAYHYPRNYGPTAPSFARANLLREGPLLISGTASIVGHASRHADDICAQLHETLNNLEALLVHAHQRAPYLSKRLDDRSLLKIYLRHAEHASLVAGVLRQRCTVEPAFVILAADICRRELLVEIDCVHGLTTGTAT